MDSEREDEEAVNALVDGMLDEELAFEASDDGSWSEPHDSDDDPPPPGGPHRPSNRFLLKRSLPSLLVRRAGWRLWRQELLRMRRRSRRLPHDELQQGLQGIGT
jgi:hypothetical protein